MSFILDALKKSESDRQRQSGPSLFEVKVAPPRRKLPVWAVAILVLLGINVIVISWMLLRRAPAQPPAAASALAAPAAAAAPVTATAAAAPGRIATQEQPPRAARVTAPIAAGNAPVTAPAASAAATPASLSPPSPSPAPPAHRADRGSGQQPADGNSSDYAPAVEPASTPGSAASAGPAGALPIYQQIVTTDGLPALHLDLHVFAENPKDRFVMINMHRVAEGDSLPNGVQVEAIRPDGVVLSYHGVRFLLPRD